MKKFLYFASATIDGTDASEEVACFPVERISHFEMKTATDLRIYFDSTVGQETNTGDADIHVDHAYVSLDVTTGKHKEVIEAITGAIASAPAINNPMIVVADNQNSKYLHPNITSVGIFVVDVT